MSYRMFLAALVGLWTVAASSQILERTVIDNERGMLFTPPPYDGDYYQMGLYMGRRDLMAQPGYAESTFLNMQPDAVKGIGQVYLQHLCPEWDGYYILDELRAFECDEVRLGREPFLITATYQRKKRPVLWSRTLPGTPKAEESGTSLMRQAVNIGDERFIKFWVKNGIRKNLSPYALQNWGFCIDNCNFEQDLYAILDDAGTRHRVVWDRPFPQTDAEWVDAAEFALKRIKELAPDLNVLVNSGIYPLNDMSRYTEVFEPIDGLLAEAFMTHDGHVYGAYQGNNRAMFLDGIRRFLPPFGTAAYKIQIFDIGIPPFHTLTEFLNCYLAHLVCAGPNSFIHPRVAWSPGIEADPHLYAAVKNALGLPVEPPQSAPEGLGGLWWRRHQGGIVYLNLTGTEKSVFLPADGPFYDSSGSLVSTIELSDGQADYVTTESGERIAMPRINPRRAGLVTGPLTITLETGPFTSSNLCEIFYTVDGSEPDQSSTPYVGPFEIHSSCVVRAKAFDAIKRRKQSLPSFVNLATYTLTDDEPMVEFHLASDSGSEFMQHDYPVVSLSHVSAHPVMVRYAASKGTARAGLDYELPVEAGVGPGTLTINPGEQHRPFNVHIINDRESEPNETIRFVLFDPVNATLGERRTYIYTIEDNDPDLSLASLDFREGFERGFVALDWQLPTWPPWRIDESESHTGSHSAKASVFGDEQQTSLSIRLDCQAGDVRFWCKVSSELGGDFLEFSIDGQLRGWWSGIRSWQAVSFPVTSGLRTFTWTYTKDGASASGEDAAWIDDIVFPAR